MFNRRGLSLTLLNFTVMESICIDCGIVFNYTSIKKDVIRCGKCVRKLYNKNYRAKNREKIAIMKRNWIKENEDRHKKCNKIWREKNKDLLAKKEKLWREKNKDKIIIYKEKNKDKIALIKKTYRDNLTDGYIAADILRIPLLECPTELIELKRAVIMLKREINK